jgi:hypothetical protein
MQKKVKLRITWSGTVELQIDNQQTELEVIAEFPEDANLDNSDWLSQESVGEAITSELETSIIADSTEDVLSVIIDEIEASVISLENVDD